MVLKPISIHFVIFAHVLNDAAEQSMELHVIAEKLFGGNRSEAAIQDFCIKL